MQSEGKLPPGAPKKYANAFKAYGIIARCAGGALRGLGRTVAGACAACCCCGVQDCSPTQAPTTPPPPKRIKKPNQPTTQGGGHVWSVEGSGPQHCAQRHHQCGGAGFVRSDQADDAGQRHVYGGWVGRGIGVVGVVIMIGAGGLVAWRRALYLLLPDHSSACMHDPPTPCDLNARPPHSAPTPTPHTNRTTSSPTWWRAWAPASSRCAWAAPWTWSSRG